MAGGGRFDETALTAAHPSLPLHSLILVTNLLNGRTVRVEVADRGPRHGRGLDLSQRAAQLIGLERCGLAPVLISAAPAAAGVREGVVQAAFISGLYRLTPRHMEFLWPPRPDSRRVQQARKQ